MSLAKHEEKLSKYNETDNEKDKKIIITLKVSMFKARVWIIVKKKMMPQVIRKWVYFIEVATSISNERELNKRV